MTLHRAFSAFVCCLALSACHAEVAEGTPDAGDSAVKINRVPTGSIPIPSLCDRVEVDARVTSTGVDSFDFVWADDHYVVVYADLATHNVFVMQLATDGSVIGEPTAIETSASPASLPAILRVDSGFIVAWEEDATPATLRVHALDTSGHPTASGMTVATARSAQLRPVLTQSPNGVAISWMDQVANSATGTDDVGDSTTYLGLLDDTLHLRTDVPVTHINASTRSGYPWLAGDSDSLGILWSDELTDKIDTYFSLVDSTLTLTAQTDVRDADAVDSALLGRLEKSDFGYLAAWEDHRSGSEEIYMSLLDPTGTKYAGGLVEEPGTGSANWPQLAWTGSAAAVVYYQFRSGKPQIFMTFIDQHGDRIGGAADAQISNTTEWSRYPDVLWTGSEFGVLWIDARDGQPELYFNRAVCEKPAPI